MYQTIPAVFEHGTFRPLKKVSLNEHQMLLLKIEIPKKNYNSLLETIEILSDKKQLDRIQSALNNIKKKKVFTHKDIFGHLQPNPWILPSYTPPKLKKDLEWEGIRAEISNFNIRTGIFFSLPGAEKFKQKLEELGLYRITILVAA